jgi:hypothetical protein
LWQRLRAVFPKVMICHCNAQGFASNAIAEGGKRNKTGDVTVAPELHEDGCRIRISSPFA